MAAPPTETKSRWRIVSGPAWIIVPALGLIAITWAGTISAIRAQSRQADALVEARVTNQAANLQQELRRELLDLDQTLRTLAAAWQADPLHFDLNAWRARAVGVSDISHDMLVADRTGRIVQATAPGQIGTSIAHTDYFLAVQHQAQADQDAFLGGVSRKADGQPWYMELARAALMPDGGFAGAVALDWQAGAIDSLFREADIGPSPLLALVGLQDGKLRAIDGPAADPDAAIDRSAMFQALSAAPNGIWIGRSAPDGVLRFHAFRQIPGRDLVVVVGMDYGYAFSRSRAWAHQALLFAGCISVLLAAMAGLLLLGRVQARNRQAALTHDRGVLAAANAQLAVANDQLAAAKSRADAKTAQLQATLEGMSDGVAMMDRELNLVEWNENFAEIAGVPRGILRVGLPLADILRAQARNGQFGPVDVNAEVARRMAILRAGGAVGLMERRRPDGHTIELRRNRLRDGSFVTLYSDVTVRKQDEDALREARAIAESATEAKSRFTAIVSHEIRTPLSALLSTLALLSSGGLPLPQQALLDLARQSGDALLGLINDILDMARMEAGQLTLRPSVFRLHDLLDGVLEIFRHQAAERGITLALAAAPDLPGELYADPGRLRQVLINLLSNAVKFGQPGAVGLLAAVVPDEYGRPFLRLAVRDRGPVIEPAGRARLFQPFSRLEGDADSAMPLGSGLGLAICRMIVSLMGGQIGCDPWMAGDGRGGNEFWLLLPVLPLPAMQRRSSAAGRTPRRLLPRTRILLVEDVLANQLVTATLLRREGHMVDVAAEGAQALAMAASRPYDLVFMDIFMPGMNGFEVARALRTLPPPAGLVPVVALTASITPEDQAMAREVHMDRLLAKPAALPEMVQVIADLAWRGLPERGATPHAAAPEEADAPVLAFDRIVALRNSLPGDMLGGMVTECLVDLQVRLPKLRQAMESGDSIAVAAHAHAMVGMAAGYGMSSLEARLRALMLASRDSDPSRAATLAAELDAELSMAANALRDALAIEMV